MERKFRQRDMQESYDKLVDGIVTKQRKQLEEMSDEVLRAGLKWHAENCQNTSQSCLNDFMKHYRINVATELMPKTPDFPFGHIHL